jgi:hypothetical protein
MNDMKKGRLFGLVLILFLGLLVSLAFVSAGELRVTEEHPFLINGTWISASQLKVGDILQTSDGKKVRITSVEDVVSSEPFLVYNLEASEYSNFVVDSGDGARVVVHNSNRPSWTEGSVIYKKGYTQVERISSEGNVQQVEVPVLYVDLPKRIGGVYSHPLDSYDLNKNLDLWAFNTIKKAGMDPTKEDALMLSVRMLNKRVSVNDLYSGLHEIMHASGKSESLAWAAMPTKTIGASYRINVINTDGTISTINYKLDFIQKLYALGHIRYSPITAPLLAPLSNFAGYSFYTLKFYSGSEKFIRFFRNPVTQKYNPSEVAYGFFLTASGAIIEGNAIYVLFHKSPEQQPPSQTP